MTNNQFRFAFFGTDQFSVKVLNTLKERGLSPALVVTQSAKPAGRKQMLTEPPVKIWATINNVPAIQPLNLKTDPEMKNLADNFDFFVVASYGKIIPKEILNLPRRGVLNIHPSLLPKYRGPSPLEATILSGDAETGVTIMQMDAEIDHGPIVESAKYEIRNPEQITYSELRDALADLGANILADTIPAFLTDKITPKEQDHQAATFTKLIAKTDGEIDPINDPVTAWRKYRAFSNWPGVYFFKDSKRIIVKKAKFTDNKFIIERVIEEGKTETDWVNP